MFRWEMYHTDLRDLGVVLSYRLTLLDYGKTHELQSIQADQRDTIRSPFGTDRRPEGLDCYRKKYVDFQRIEWLKLPPRLFPLPTPPDNSLGTPPQAVPRWRR